MIFTPKVTETFKRFIGNKQKAQSILCEYKNEALTVCKSPLKILKFYIGVVLTIIYATYLLAQLVFQLKSKHKHESNQYFVDLLWTFLWGLYWVWSLGNISNIICKQSDSVNLIEGMMRLDKEFDSKYY
jgi:bacteriorhodopsin